jgi:hypothetical protein
MSGSYKTAGAGRRHDGPMDIDLSTVAAFMATHARVVDRRRFELLTGRTDPVAVLAALDGHRNPDGGYGWGMEPDLRAPESQPAGALHAFEVLEDIAPATSPRAAELCDWLASVTLPDGGLPFALPVSVTAGTSPWWAGADPKESSLQITSVTAAVAHRVAATDPAVAAHPWLAKATDYCLAAIDALDERPFAYVLAFSIRFLDAVHDTRPEAAELLRRLGSYIPPDGEIQVVEGEMLHPLDVAPFPNRPARTLFTPEVIAADLARLAAGIQDDGGWTVDHPSSSPAGALDWRGHTTVKAVKILQANATG